MDLGHDAQVLIPLLLLPACRPGPPPNGGLADSELLLFHSEDGRAFRQVGEPLAQGFDALGLLQQGERVVVTGLDHRRRIPWTERYRTPRVQEWVLEAGTWSQGSRAVAVDAPALIDPQWEGETLWYVAREGLGDPALGGENRVMRGSEEVLKGPGLADPCPVRFREQDLLFTTQWGKGVVLWSGSPLSPQRTWPQLTVPFARVEGEGAQAVLALYAVGVVQGKRLPVRLESANGRDFGSQRALILSPEPSSCTSPVTWSDAQGQWLLCVHEATPSTPPGE